MDKPIRNKAEFDDWFEDIINDLNLRVGSLDFSTENLQKIHWKEIWKIYDVWQEERFKKPGESSEDYAYENAKLIILKAHNMDESDFMQQELMEDYTNSSSYD